MRTFLSKFLDAATLANVEEAYKAKNPEATGLPIYIPKTRFDEVSAKLKTAEDTLKGVPIDWSTQLSGLQEQLKNKSVEYEKQLADQKSEYESKLAAAGAESARTAKVYGAGARNVKAVMALLDLDKDIDEQLTALRQSDPYLFNESNVPKGTGKGDGNHGGEGDDKGTNTKLSSDDMYRAVGIPIPVK